MRKISTISKHTFQLLLGLTVGFFLIIQTPTDSNVTHEGDSQEQSSQESGAGETDKIQIAEAVPTTSPQINLGFQSILLQVVILTTEVEDQKTLVVQALPATQKALKVILRRIMAPNAP